MTKFTKDPLFSSLNTTEQTELVNYLKSKPVEQKQSKEYSHSLVQGLKNRGQKTNPTELAKALSQIIKGGNIKEIPSDLKPLLSSSLQVSGNKNKAVPINYNFSDTGDINRLKYDPVLSSYNSNDQEELLSYLKTNPVSVKNSKNFSRSLTSGLNNLPKNMKPTSFASSLASKINRKSVNISRPNNNYNLLNTAGRSSFFKSNTFKSSGVSKKKFTSMINNNKSRMNNYTPDSSVMFPLSFRTGNTAKIENSNNSNIDKENNIYNQSHVVKRTHNQNKPVVKSINSYKIKDVYAGFNKPKANTTTSAAGQVSSQISAINTNTPTRPMTKTTGMNHQAETQTYSRSTPKAKPKPQTKPNITTLPTKTPEQQKMDRIQQNYLDDKNALANEGRSMPSGQQMLAKSKNSDSGSAGGGSKKATSGGRAVKEASVTLSEEIRSNIENDIV